MIILGRLYNISEAHRHGDFVLLGGSRALVLNTSVYMVLKRFESALGESAIVLNQPWVSLQLTFVTFDVVVQSHLYMSLVVRKSVFGVSDQVPHKPGCTATDVDGWRLEISDLRSRGIVLSV